ncbi:peptidoglycan-binding protein [Bacillus velezensis]|nr:peptidoglycan-binding protein [Bacillus velezensis]
MVPKTANAVKRFQSIYGLTADGIYEPKTKVKLEILMK